MIPASQSVAGLCLLLLAFMVLWVIAQMFGGNR